MLNNIKTWALVSIICLSASPAWADNYSGQNKSSLIINAGYAKESNACASPWYTLVMTGTGCSENHKAYRLAYSYQFTPTWVDLHGFSAWLRLVPCWLQVSAM